MAVVRATPGAPDQLVGADRISAGDLEDAAAFVIGLLDEPGGDIHVAQGQLGLGEDVVVPGHPDGFHLESIERFDPGVVWAIDGGSCLVADGRSFSVAAHRVARVRFADGATDLIESPALRVTAMSGERLERIAREALSDLGEDPERLPDLPRPVDALREWAEWRAIRETVAEADPGDLVLVDGSLHGGPLVPPTVVRRVHQEALDRLVSLAGVVKASTLYWGRHAPLVTLLKRRGDRELGPCPWAARISTDPVFARLYVGEIFVAHLASTAAYAFRVDIARGPAEPAEILGRLAGLAGDPAFVGYPYPLARAHQAARITGYAVADTRRAFRDSLSRAGLPEDDIEVLFDDFHLVLNRS
jgi:hypothetical protein